MLPTDGAGAACSGCATGAAGAAGACAVAVNGNAKAAADKRAINSLFMFTEVFEKFNGNIVSLLSEGLGAKLVPQLMGAVLSGFKGFLE